MIGKRNLAVPGLPKLWNARVFENNTVSLAEIWISVHWSRISLALPSRYYIFDCLNKTWHSGLTTAAIGHCLDEDRASGYSTNQMYSNAPFLSITGHLWHTGIRPRPLMQNNTVVSPQP